MVEAFEFLDKMPYNKRYAVKTEQMEAIKLYMSLLEWDGGIHFSGDFKTIYKTRIPEV